METKSTLPVEEKLIAEQMFQRLHRLQLLTIPVEEKLIAEQMGVNPSWLRSLRKKGVLKECWRKVGKIILYWPDKLNEELLGVE